VRAVRAKERADRVQAGTAIVLRLYVAGRAPNSVKAIANLEEICRQHLVGRYHLELVDVCEDPLRALADGILVTPCLIKVSPAPGSSTIGNLSDTSSVLAALGLQFGDT
jgi:circadian clock protein KaiB